MKTKRVFVLIVIVWPVLVFTAIVMFLQLAVRLADYAFTGKWEWDWLWVEDWRW